MVHCTAGAVPPGTAVQNGLGPAAGTAVQNGLGMVAGTVVQNELGTAAGTAVQNELGTAVGDQRTVCSFSPQPAELREA